ncbi:MAG: SpoIIE family protein phosphatase [Bacteroidia bacterium]|nr:SpoIIE family protein phosphatase [Bacteroidia bacterium]
MKISFQNKIRLTVISIVLLFSTFMFLYYPAKQLKMMQNNYNNEVHNTAKTVALGVKIALTEQNFEGIQTAMDFAKSNDQLLFIAMAQVDSTWENDSLTISKSLFKTFPEDYELDVDVKSTALMIVKRAPFVTEILKGEIIVGVSTEKIIKSITDLRITSFIVSVLVFLFGSVIGLWLAKSIARPIIQLRVAADQVGSGDLSQKVDVVSNDQIGQLSLSFNKMVSDLGSAQEEIKHKNESLTEQNKIIEDKNKDITDSINYAKRIQEAILPPYGSLEQTIKESFILFKPKDIVSGDFYWYHVQNDNLIIAAVDCTGHGVPGAFMSMIGNSLLNEIILEKGIDQPAEILNNLHVGIRKVLKQTEESESSRDGMDLALCNINFKNQTLQYAAANRPLYILRKVELKDGNKEYNLKEFPPDKIAIGGYQHEGAKRVFFNNEIEFNHGDCLYIFSDGYNDQFGGPRDKKFSTRRFKELVLSICNKPMREQHDILYKEMADWMHGYEQIDDMLIIGARL